MKRDRGSRPFDWAEIKRRLRQVQASLDAAGKLSDDQIREVMAERARRLAEVPEQPLDTSELLEVVRFQIRDEQLAIAARFVFEFTRPDHITPIPDLESHFLGVTNLRGTITTVVDLGDFFGLPTKSRADAQVLVLGRETPEVAIVVDGMDHVSTIRRQDILEPTAGLGSIVELLIGCTAEAVLILDGEALLQFDGLYIDQKEP